MKLIKSMRLRNFLRNIPFLFSFAGLLIFYECSGSDSHTPLLVAAGAVALAVSLACESIYTFYKDNHSAYPLSILLAGSVSIYLTYEMYRNIRLKTFVTTSADRLGMSLEAVAMLLAVLCFFLSAYAAYVVSLYICKALRFDKELSVSGENLGDSNKSGNRCTYVTKRQLAVIILTAAATMTICTQSSPLYPLNTWDDANCFFTMGKSMLHGKVLYKDLYEQKGPLLYMLHALAALVSETSFLGVYFLEIIAAVFFLYFSFKIMRLYSGSISIFILPVMSLLVYTAYAFRCGDSAEELCLPFYAFAIYVGLKGIRKNTCPTMLECFAVGATAVCILWIKYNMLGFYVGWVIVPIYLLMKSRNIKNLFKMFGMILAGVAAVSLPILLYFVVNSALSDLWTVYFYNNIFSYGKVTEDGAGVFGNIIKGINFIFTYAAPTFALIIAGFLALIKRKEKGETVFFVLSVLGTLALTFIGRRQFPYYSLIFSAFLPIGLAAAYNAVHDLVCSRVNREVKKIFLRTGAAATCVLCVLLTYKYSGNTENMFTEKSDLVQYQFAEIINETEDATLLNYGFMDGGFYTAAGIVPNCKYFTGLNIDISEIPDTQDEYVNNGWVDYVVTEGELGCGLYELAAEDSGYCLYRLKGLNDES